MAKLYLNEAFVQSSLDTLHLHGGYGYSTEAQIERDLRDALTGRIRSGTSEIQKELIARSLGVWSFTGTTSGDSPGIIESTRRPWAGHNTTTRNGGAIMTVESRIRDYVQERFLRNGQTEIGTSDSLLDSGLIDSAGIFDLVAYLESEFGIQVMDEEITPEHFESVGTITAFVDGKL